MENKVLICIGCNSDCPIQMQSIRECLMEAFPDACFTKTLVSPAVGMPEGTADYANMLATFETEQSEDELTDLFKDMETKLGNTKELRTKGIVMMDLDILQYGGERRHQRDWSRPYIQQLLESKA